MEKTLEPAIGVHDFEDIVRRKLIYVDKTNLPAKLISSPAKTWFLARPRRFGESLTVSTTHSIFTGQKEIFKDLENAIKNIISKSRS
ncbi:MAG: AAA family ATPase [Deltaproteobacteria bacterium]|jgi:hypothetical protein|nr:AAA family ATPase [Deltaproteobacteria bacterium]